MDVMGDNVVNARNISLAMQVESIKHCGSFSNLDSLKKSVADKKTKSSTRSSSLSNVSDANIENESAIQNASSMDADYEEIGKGSVCSSSSTSNTEDSLPKYSNHIIPSNLPSNLPLVTPEEYSLQTILREERTVPRSHVYLISLLFLVVLLINILKGGGGFPSPLGITCGSTAFWASQLVIFLWTFAVSSIARNYLLLRSKEKQLSNYPYVEGDVRWDERTTIIYPVFCTAAGFFAGMFGVGGGIVKGPLMLAMGVHPAVASATSACMIFFTSFVATTSFAVFGVLEHEYSVFSCIVGFTATLVGQTTMTYLVKKFKRDSYIAYCIGLVVAISAVCLTIQALIGLVKGEGAGVDKLCSEETLANLEPEELVL